MAGKPTTERVVLLEANARALHQRVDKVEHTVLTKITEMEKDIKLILAELNRGKGWVAAGLLAMSVVGGGVTLIINHFWK